jgi:hypothetical protein
MPHPLQARHLQATPNHGKTQALHWEICGVCNASKSAMDNRFNVPRFNYVFQSNLLAARKDTRKIDRYLYG